MGDRGEEGEKEWWGVWGVGEVECMWDFLIKDGLWVLEREIGRWIDRSIDKSINRKTVRER